MNQGRHVLIDDYAPGKFSLYYSMVIEAAAVFFRRSSSAASFTF